MKQLVLSIVMCWGVGMAAMAAPAQVSGDDNLPTRSEVTSIHKRPLLSIRPVEDIAKHKAKLRKFDRLFKKQAVSNSSKKPELNTIYNTTSDQVPLKKIKKDPVPAVGPGHHNDPAPGSKIVRTPRNGLTLF